MRIEQGAQSTQRDQIVQSSIQYFLRKYFLVLTREAWGISQTSVKCAPKQRLVRDVISDSEM